MLNRIVPGIVCKADASVLRALGAGFYTHDNRRPTLITEHPLLVMGRFHDERGRKVFSLCSVSSTWEPGRTEILSGEKQGGDRWVHTPANLVGTEIYHLFEDELLRRIGASLERANGSYEYLPRGPAFHPKRSIRSDIVPRLRITLDRVTPGALDRLEDAILVPGVRIR